MPKDREQTGIPFTFTVKLDGSPTETSGKSLLELAIEQNPDIPEEEIETAVCNTMLNAYKIVLRKDYERLKDQIYDEMSDEDKKTWLAITFAFSDEISAEREARFSRLVAECEACSQRERLARKRVTREIAEAESVPEPIFMLNLPDEYLVKLAEAGFTSVGQVLFSIKISREMALDAYLAEDDETKSKRLIEYLKITKTPLPEIVGEIGYSLLGSRLLQYDYVARNEFLDLFRGGIGNA
jgi:hypothetical protein